MGEALFLLLVGLLILLALVLMKGCSGSPK